MIYTARQLEEMHRSAGQIVLPYRARLTPLAKDWVREKEISVGYSEASASDSKARQSQNPLPGPPPEYQRRGLKSGLPLLWWSDGATGSARAAVTSAGKELSMEQLAIGQDVKQLPAAIKLLAGQLNAKKIGGGVLLMKNPSLGLLYANRSSALRAAAASTLMALDEAINAVAPNVLVIEHARLTVQQIKNMIVRFGRSGPGPSEVLLADLKEMAQCA
jgi:hypothetical protein